MLGKKTDGLLEILRILKLLEFHEAPHTVAQLYPQIFQQTIMSVFFPSNLL
jgi:hypothetical protein